MQRSRAPSNRVVLLLIDVINAFAFEGSGPLVRAAERSAPNIDGLAERARRRGVPVVYVNDNFGQWRSDFQSTVRACTNPDQPGHLVAGRLRPKRDDYFVLKPQHSGFYSTTLDLLLDYLGAHTLVLTGFATNLCVLFTANDAHMRGFHIVVPSDCTASNTRALTRAALDHVKTPLSGEVMRAAEVDFAKLAKKSRRHRGQPF